MPLMDDAFDGAIFREQVIFIKEVILAQEGVPVLFGHIGPDDEDGWDFTVDGLVDEGVAAEMPGSDPSDKKAGFALLFTTNDEVGAVGHHKSFPEEGC